MIHRNGNNYLSNIPEEFPTKNSVLRPYLQHLDITTCGLCKHNEVTRDHAYEATERDIIPVCSPCSQKYSSSSYSANTNRFYSQFIMSLTYDCIRSYKLSKFCVTEIADFPDEKENLDYPNKQHITFSQFAQFGLVLDLSPVVNKNQIWLFYFTTDNMTYALEVDTSILLYIDTTKDELLDSRMEEFTKIVPKKSMFTERDGLEKVLFASQI